jgi:CheY-like chemotaxis protein
MIEKMRDAVTNVTPKVTLSFGVAAAYPSAEFTPQGLQERADGALLKAKKSGANSIEGDGTSGAEIMIIEDEPLTRRLMEQILGNAGYAVRSAPDGESGYAMAMARPPALILLDIGLPGKSGFKIAEMFRDNPATRGIKLVAMTARRSWADYDTAFASGIVAYLEKPVDAKALIRAIEETLQK